MNPYEHGEVYVLDDGYIYKKHFENYLKFDKSGEVDLDLGNYERFLHINFTQYHNMTTGKVYQRIFSYKLEK